MRVLHDTGTVTEFGHSSYRPYDAVHGKLASLSPTGRVYACDCGKRFATKQERDDHRCRPRDE